MRRDLMISDLCDSTSTDDVRREAMPGAALVASPELARSQIDFWKGCLFQELSTRLGAFCEYWYETSRFAQLHGLRPLETDQGPPNGCVALPARAWLHGGAGR